MSTRKQPTIGLALGSGSARGLAHIGIIHELENLGIYPDVVCGSSIGALIGGVYVAGKLDLFEEWVRKLTTRKIIRLLDIRLSGGGLWDAGNLIQHLRKEYGDFLIQDLRPNFAAVATDLKTGHELWLKKGDLWTQVRASIAIPGVLKPMKMNDSWVADGGLVNPVPVSVCRALGAERIIAINLNGDIVGKHFKKKEENISDSEGFEESFILDRIPSAIKDKVKDKVSPKLSQWLGSYRSDSPGLVNVMTSAINIMQDRITRSRLAGEPADVLLTPHLADIGWLDFVRVEEAIEEGRECVRRNIPLLQHSLGLELK